MMMSTFQNELSNSQIIEMVPQAAMDVPHPDTSDSYSFVPTMDAVNLLRDDGWVPCMAKAPMGNESKFGLHLVQFTRKELKLDKRFLLLNLYNSHNGKSSFKLLGGIYELVCSNGLVLPEYDEFSFIHRHLGFDVDFFLEQAAQLSQGLLGLVDRIHAWQELELDRRMQERFANVALRLVYGEKSPYEPAQILEARRQEDNLPTLWKTFNRVQENIVKGGIHGVNAAGRRVLTRGITGITSSKDVNQTLFILAEETEKMVAA